MACYATVSRPLRKAPRNVGAGGEVRAGDGNRTRIASLEGWNSAIELHPRGGEV